MLSNFDQRLDISSLNNLWNTSICLCCIAAIYSYCFSGKLMAETAEPSGMPTNPCYQLILFG